MPDATPTPDAPEGGTTAPPAAPPALWDRVPREWRLAVVAYITTRIPLVLFAWLIHHFQPRRLRTGHFLYHGGAPHSSWLVDAFQKWDSYWFLNIVREGYHYFGPVEQISHVVAGRPETNVTPFPLYPGLMRVLATLVGDPSVAGLIISQVCFIGALVVLYRLARVGGSEALAVGAVWLFAANPTTYAYTAIYSESLFFLMTVWAVLELRRGRYALAGVTGMLSALSRLPGVFVLLPMLLDHWRQRRVARWRVLWLGLVPLGTLAYFVYLYAISGEPFAYFVGQEGWHKEFVGPLYHPLEWLRTANFTGQMTLDMVTTLVVGATLVLGFRRIRVSDWVYALFGFLMLISSSYLLGLPRYCSALYPLYFIWAGLGERHPVWGRGLLVLFAMTSLSTFWVWTTWRYAF